VGKERVCARVACELWVTDAHGVHVCKLSQRVISKDDGHVLSAL
jgi:hypothetical protein